jgi:peptidoglycan/xylan/chitin deacetylase (PgdA/CDA1 family)
MRSSARKIASGLRDQVRLRLRHGPAPTVLMYHRIAEEPFDPWGLAVAPARFKEQIEWLARNRQPLSLREFAELHRRRRLPREAVAITFDDGYACASEIAAPLLREIGVPATIFLPVDLIERRQVFWWDELEEIVLGHDAASLHVGCQEIALGPEDAADRRWEPRSEPSTQRQKAFAEILTLMTRRKPAERDRMMDELRAQAPRANDLPPSKRPLTPEQVRTVAGRGVEFGSHTRTHPWLSDLSPAEQMDEIGGSVARLEAITRRRPAAFAYPYGTWNEQSRDLVKAAGFACACTTAERAVSNRSHSFSLPRVRVGNWESAGLEQALSRVLPG